MNLEIVKKRKILLLGKPRAFSNEEFLAQLEVEKITLVKELDEDVEFILEGRMMTPYEQNLSDELYEKGGYTFLKIDDFERGLAQQIDDNVLLMSLKLSNDKERLKSFLQNSCVSDTLFFKLLKMYSWGGEDFFENDDNRDVTAALIGRFYENIERNHNVQYATTGLIHLISQTDKSELLEAISTLEPLLYHPQISILLAQHSKTPKKVLKKLLHDGKREVLEAMSANSSLELSIIKDLIAKDTQYAKILAQKISLTKETFELLREFSVELAKNETLESSMQKELLAFQDPAIYRNLATNKMITQESIEYLMSIESEDLRVILLQNPNMDQTLLREAYKNPLNYQPLATNSATPVDILEALFESGEDRVLEALSHNEATPVDILYQLQLDSRFERAVKTNPAFGKHIQSQNIGWLV
jgi:hypothetical protein